MAHCEAAGGVHTITVTERDVDGQECDEADERYTEALEKAGNVMPTTQAGAAAKLSLLIESEGQLDIKDGPYLKMAETTLAYMEAPSE